MPQRPMEEFVPREEQEPELPDFRVFVDMEALPPKYRRLLEEKESPLLDVPKELVFRSGINLLVGANGTGKSTLLHGISQAYFPDQMSSLSDASRLDRALATAMSNLMQVEQSSEFSVAIDIEPGKSIQSAATRHLSQRQGLDLLLQKMLRQYDEELEINTGEEPDLDELILCIDEPEMGMDPQRHKQILTEIQSLRKYANYVFVATNSPYLFESDLPRFDLSQPEKGVFVPSEELAKNLAGGFNETAFEE